MHFKIEIDLRAKPERDRVHRLQVGGVPMGALADRIDRRFGGADEAHDLRVLELGMIAHQPQDCVRAVLAARHRRVAWPLLALGGGRRTFGSETFSFMSGSDSPWAICSRVS